VHASSIDLNQHYGNASGSFAPGSSGYKDESRNDILVRKEEQHMLVSDLAKDESGGWAVGEKVDLAIRVINDSGCLKFEDRFVLVSSPRVLLAPICRTPQRPAGRPRRTPQQHA
jgi:hypothetical protein